MDFIGIVVEPPQCTSEIEFIGRVKETLSRLGIANKKDMVLYPSCYLFIVDDGDFRVAHFKELFPLVSDNGINDASDDDISRRNMIVKLLGQWGLIQEVEDDDVQDEDRYIFVLSYKNKNSWTIEHKIKTVGLLN